MGNPAEREAGGSAADGRRADGRAHERRARAAEVGAGASAAPEEGRSLEGGVALGGGGGGAPGGGGCEGGAQPLAGTPLESGSDAGVRGVGRHTGRRGGGVDAQEGERLRRQGVPPLADVSAPASPPPATRGLPRARGTARRLFGPPPSSHELAAFFASSEEDERRQAAEASARYNFDFEAFKPLPPGEWEWERQGAPAGHGALGDVSGEAPRGGPSSDAPEHEGVGMGQELSQAQAHAGGQAQPASRTTRRRERDRSQARGAPAAPADEPTHSTER